LIRIRSAASSTVVVGGSVVEVVERALVWVVETGVVVVVVDVVEVVDPEELQAAINIRATARRTMGITLGRPCRHENLARFRTDALAPAPALDLIVVTAVFAGPPTSLSGRVFRRCQARRSFPAMRMVIGLSNLAASTLIHSTAQSGHTFHAHYGDMIEGWARATGTDAPYERTGRGRGGGHASLLLRQLTRQRA
jgi:hypothetical protein